MFFCLFQCFEEKEYQTESKRNETFGRDLFGTNVIQRTWSASQETSEAAMRVPETPPTGGRAPHPRGSLDRPLTYLFLLYIPMYPENIRSDHENYFHHRNLLYPRDPILEPLSALRRRGNRPRRASTSTP